MFGANSVIQVPIYDESSREKAELPRILSQNDQNDLKSHGQWRPFSIPAASFPWCMFGTNFVIPSQICEELCAEKLKFTDRRTDIRTDAGNDNTLLAWKVRE